MVFVKLGILGLGNLYTISRKY